MKKSAVGVSSVNNFVKHIVDVSMSCFKEPVESPSPSTHRMDRKIDYFTRIRPELSRHFGQSFSTESMMDMVRILSQIYECLQSNAADNSRGHSNNLLGVIDSAELLKKKICKISICWAM